MNNCCALKKMNRLQLAQVCHYFKRELSVSHREQYSTVSQEVCSEIKRKDVEADEAATTPDNSVTNSSSSVGHVSIAYSQRQFNAPRVLLVEKR